MFRTRYFVYKALHLLLCVYLLLDVINQRNVSCGVAILTANYSWVSNYSNNRQTFFLNKISVLTNDNFWHVRNEKLQKQSPISFAMSAPRFFKNHSMHFHEIRDIRVLLTFVVTLPLCLKSGNYNWHFTWRHTCLSGSNKLNIKRSKQVLVTNCTHQWNTYSTYVANTLNGFLK
jgi:hypothetical protein